MKKLIGRFGVDSGQAMVGDPCYLDAWNQESDFNYERACEATIKKEYGVLGHGKSVVFSTGYGDGLYPVYAEINDEGRIEKITIDFVGSEDYDEEEGDDESN